MIAQLVFTGLLLVALVYARIAYSSSRATGLLAMLTTLVGMFFVWSPGKATILAEWVGIGRGVDLIIYTWIAISLIVLVNLHLKLREQMEVITQLARRIAIYEADHAMKRFSNEGSEFSKTEEASEETP